MKRLVLQIIIILFFFTQSVQGQLLLKVEIENLGQKNVSFYEPIKGFYNQDFETPISLKNTGKLSQFEKSIDLYEGNMFCLKIGTDAVYFYGEPGDSINLSIDVEKFSIHSPNRGIVFSGNNRDGNEYFNKFNWQPGKKFGDFEEILVDSLHFRENYNFSYSDFAIHQATSFFDTLLVMQKITPSFYDVVVGGIKSVLIGSEIRYLLVGQNEIPFDDAMVVANGIYNRYPVSTSVIKRHVFGNQIAYYYYKTMAATRYSSEQLTDSALYLNGKELIVNRNLVSWLFAPTDIQEIFWAKNLITLKSVFADKFGKKDADVYLEVYPNSPLRNFLLPPHFEDFTLNNEVDSSLIRQISDTSVLTFKDLIGKYFSGKKVFVDFWASWCVPCKQEFAFQKELDSFCFENNIEKLYISFDKSPFISTMEKNIYAYNLKGFHIRVNKYLLSDIMKRFYPGAEQYSIPRYLIVDETGIVVNADAPRPSSGQELFQTLKVNLNIQEKKSKNFNTNHRENMN